MSDFEDYFEDEDFFFDDGAADDMVCFLNLELGSIWWRLYVYDD